MPVEVDHGKSLFAIILAQLGSIERGRIHCETENPHCFCSISICFVMRMAFCA